MKYYYLTAILIISMCLAFTGEASAQRRRNPVPADSPQVQTQRSAASGKVSLAITSKSSATTSNPSEVMHALSVQFTNNGTSQVQFTSNCLYLLDSAGRKYLPTRKVFAETLFLQPGESKTIDRIYFMTAPDTRVESLTLFRGTVILGTTRF
ncbi:MAG: hypothetical protein RDV48_14980 [Candidatus Eremiobacteraeota bacterium]|nr:hypothetical protein [Candidatus Eremiobacteraeota bacterium]